MSLRLAAPSTIATARDTSAIPRSISGNLPARASAGPQRASQSRLVSQLAQQYRPGMARHRAVFGGDPQPVIPRRILHHERSCPGSYKRVVTS